MAEYIERDKAVAICQSYYEHCLETHDYCGDGVAYDIRMNIQGLPTADVVEVVFCKNCKHYTNIDTYRNPPRLDFHWCNKLGNVTKETDYCSYGERRCEDE